MDIPRRSGDWTTVPAMKRSSAGEFDPLEDPSRNINRSSSTDPERRSSFKSVGTGRLKHAANMISAANKIAKGFKVDVDKTNGLTLVNKPPACLSDMLLKLQSNDNRPPSQIAESRK